MYIYKIHSFPQRTFEKKIHSTSRKTQQKNQNSNRIIFFLSHYFVYARFLHFFLYFHLRVWMFFLFSMIFVIHSSVFLFSLLSFSRFVHVFFAAYIRVLFVWAMMLDYSSHGNKNETNIRFSFHTIVKCISQKVHFTCINLLVRYRNK